MSNLKKALKKQPHDNIELLESRLALLVLAATLTPSILLLFCLWYFSVSYFLVAILAVFLFFLIAYSVFTVIRQTQAHSRGIHSLLEAIVRGDYSFRGAAMPSGGPSSELVNTVNALAKRLQSQRLQSEESQLLVQKVVDQIDVAIIAWDQQHRVRMVNPAAKKLNVFKLAETDEQMSNPVTDELSALTRDMKAGETQVKDIELLNHRGRYRLHLERFVSEGEIHHLLFMTNVSSILRHEEKRAWRNLVRVLSHEINNSLTPLKSFSATLETQIEKRETDPKLKTELLEGMRIIGSRAESLSNFVESYHQLARLPDPVKKPHDFSLLIQRVTKLFSGSSVLLTGSPVVLTIDSAQIEQVLINLIKNAEEANAETERIEVLWTEQEDNLIVTIRDYGCGIQNLENMFTPYYTTKTGGSGIGLVFCQQIVEAHEGYLSIQNRKDNSGCEVIMSLPCVGD